MVTLRWMTTCIEVTLAFTWKLWGLPVRTPTEKMKHGRPQLRRYLATVFPLFSLRLLKKKHKIKFKKILPNTASKAKLAASAQVNATEPAMGRTKARACAPVVLKFWTGFPKHVIWGKVIKCRSQPQGIAVLVASGRKKRKMLSRSPLAKLLRFVPWRAVGSFKIKGMALHFYLLWLIMQITIGRNSLFSYRIYLSYFFLAGAWRYLRRRLSEPGGYKHRQRIWRGGTTITPY